MSPTRLGPRTLVVGDSWIRGLSKGQGSISRLVPAELEAREVLDISKISRIAPDVVEDFLDEIDAFAPEFAVVAVGGAESLVFPVPWFQRILDRFFPPNWHGAEGLQPSAIPARSRRARIRQRGELIAKTLVKQLVVNVFGGRRRCPLPEFETAARALLDVLAAHGTTIALFGFTDVDGLISPKTNKAIARTNALLRRLAEEYPNTLYVDTRDVVKRWDDYLVDRVHVSRAGHRLIADHLLRSMQLAGGPWADVLPVVVDAGSDSGATSGPSDTHHAVA